MNSGSLIYYFQLVTEIIPMKKNNVKFSTVSFFLLTAILCFLPEVIYLKGLGFFWDDWSQLFLHVKFGDAAFWDYFSYNRPLSAWTAIIFFPIGGTSPIRWHLLLLCLKFCLCCLFFFIMRKMIPEEKPLTESAVLLFAVCPLFSQYYISIAYTQHFTDYILFALSVLTLLHAVSAKETGKRVLFSVLSVLCTIMHLTVSEYFAFLELIKFPILYFCFYTGRSCTGSEKGNKKAALIRAAKWYLPHLIIFLSYCFYRLNISRFFHNFSAETPDLLYVFRESPAAAVRMFLNNLTTDLLYPFTGFLSRLFDFKLQSILSKSELTIIFVSILIALGSAVFFHKSKGTVYSNLKAGFILFCLLGIFLGLLPFLIMNENFLTADDFEHTDRTFLAKAPFVCLLFGWVLCKMFQEKKRLAAAAAFLIFLFCHGQMSEYNKAWQFSAKQNRFYHQLSERIPAIEDGTAIVDDTIIFPQQGNFSTASAVNILYPNPITGSGQVPVWVFSYDTREYHEHGGFHVQNRNYYFSQPPDKYIYIDHDNKFANCIWVFNPEDTDNPHVTELQRGWIRQSNINRIQFTSASEPDRTIFGNEQKNWCHYYQKAELLRQKEDWPALNKLTHRVLDEGFLPSDNRSNSPFEWWPFIEGLMRTGEEDLAYELSNSAIREDTAYTGFFENRLSQFKNQIGNR